jgi:hypothetical protein
MGEPRLLLIMTMRTMRKFPTIIAVYKSRNITKQIFCNFWLGESLRKMNSVTLCKLAMRLPLRDSNFGGAL